MSRFAVFWQIRLHVIVMLSYSFISQQSEQNPAAFFFVEQNTRARKKDAMVILAYVNFCYYYVYSVNNAQSIRSKNPSALPALCIFWNYLSLFAANGTTICSAAVVQLYL